MEAVITFIFTTYCCVMVGAKERGGFMASLKITQTNPIQLFQMINYVFLPFNWFQFKNVHVMWGGSGVSDVVSVCSAVKVVMMNIQQFIIPMITAMHKGIGWGGWIGVGWDKVWVVVVQFCPGQLHHVHRGGWRWDGFFIVELVQLARPKPVKLSYRFHVVKDFERVVLKNRDEGF